MHCTPEVQALVKISMSKYRPKYRQCERKECNHAASASLQITSGLASCRTSSAPIMLLCTTVWVPRSPQQYTPCFSTDIQSSLHGANKYCYHCLTFNSHCTGPFATSNKSASHFGSLRHWYLQHYWYLMPPVLSQDSQYLCIPGFSQKLQ